MEPEEIGRLVEEAYPVGRVVAVARLSGGYWSDVVRVDAVAGSYVARVAPEEAEMGGIAWQHELLRFLAARFSEVVAPTPARA